MNTRLLKDRWRQLWLGPNSSRAPEGVYDELVSSYSLPGRYYHNLAHIEDCLTIFDHAKSLATHSREVELAIWFHDAVYETEKSGNEQRSAEWARAVIETSSLGVESAERVYRLILATCHDAEVADLDGQIVVDVDLSILGREEEVFWHYEQNIRKEYAWVPESVFRQKRADILRSFLARPRIFNLDLYRMQFEERARLNLERAILRLDQPVEVA